MDEFLERLRSIAAQLSGQDDIFDGMASVKVEWNPYESGWIAEASWSSNKRVRSELSETPTDAVFDLLSLLEEVKRP